MITAKLEFQTAPYASGKTFQNRFNRLVSGLGRQVAQDMQPLVGRAFAPLTPIRYPIPWTSEKQRRFVMAKLRREGLPYRRTGKAQTSWVYKFISDGSGGGRFELASDNPYARYLYGALRPRGKYRQRMFNGIWPTASDGRDIVIEGTVGQLRPRYDEALGSLGVLETSK